MSNFWEWSKDVSFVNRFIFPAPKPSSYNKDSFPDELLFVPPKEKLYSYYKKAKLSEIENKNKNKSNINSPKYSLNSNQSSNETKDNRDNKENSHKNGDEYCDPLAIPCIYISRKYRLSSPTHILLYLHGNAEDLGKCYPIIDYIRMKLPVNIIAPEYPGYGVSGGEPNENSIVSMVQNVYEFIISPYGLNIPPSRVIIYGFSIGSAAALSSSNFNLNKVYIPNNYITSQSNNNDNDNDSSYSSSESNNDDDNNNKKKKKTEEEEEEEEQKYDIKKKKLKKQNTKLIGVGRKYFLSTFLKKCPHSISEHELLGFTNNESFCFYESDINSMMSSGDPFMRLPLASLLNILRKGNIEYPTSVNKKKLLIVARSHGLIPELSSCRKANIIRKHSLLIIVCPFASISQVVADKIGVFASYLLSERFKNLEAIKKAHGPLLIIHGKDDSIIPYQHSVELHRTALESDIHPVELELLDGCDHNTMDLRKITNIINKTFKHQFNLYRSSDSDQDNQLTKDHGRIYCDFNIVIPEYCWLKPESEAVELSDEDKSRLKKKQEQDDEEYAFNLFMKQLLQHESMQNASVTKLQSHQQKKLKSFFGTNNDNNNNNDNKEKLDINSNTTPSQSNQIDPEYSLSQALRLSPDDDIIIPNPNDSSSN